MFCSDALLAIDVYVVNGLARGCSGTLVEELTPAPQYAGSNPTRNNFKVLFTMVIGSIKLRFFPKVMQSCQSSKIRYLWLLLMIKLQCQ